MRSREGLPLDTYISYIAEGLFMNNTEVAEAPFQTFGEYQEGDIRYAELSGDQFINEDDQKPIGNYFPRFTYGINLNLQYRNLKLYALFTGVTGRDVMLNNFDQIWLVSVPLLLGFVIVVSYNLVITRLFGLKYREGIITVLIGSSSHFEIAIATAVAMYGVGSIAALGTTMGLFWEVPIMLGLVYLGKFLRKKNFWESEE